MAQTQRVSPKRRRLWESEKSELERSLRVQQQLRAVLLPLQQRFGQIRCILFCFEVFFHMDC